MSIVLPNLIIGPLVVVVGVLVFVFRGQLRDMTVNAEKGALGERRGQAFGQLQTPFWFGVVGVGGVLIGMAMVAGGLITLITASR